MVVVEVRCRYQLRGFGLLQLLLDLYREISFPRRFRYNRPAHGDEGKAALQAFRRLEVGPFFRSVETRRGVLE